MFEGFDDRTVTTAAGVPIRTRRAGDGPPVLLLHGYPQTHACWHRVAPALAAAGFTVVATDLRGYGDSGKPEGGACHAGYAKRAMAQDQVEVMAELGFERFQLVGHDRGGRVAHRLALDHPERVERLAVLDIAPTATMYGRTDQAFATAYYHWFFLIQPADLPERMIGADPLFYLRRTLASWTRVRGEPFTAEALAEYERCFADPAAIHAACEDYRAAAGIDLEHDAADSGRRLAMPLLALWGGLGVVGRLFDPLAAWREKADDVRGHALPCGHFLPEEAPEETVEALLGFLAR